MLEILILISLTSKIGAIVEQKGYQSGGYKWSAVAWWFGGEGGLPMYIIGLVGAAIGASIAYSTANNLLEIGPPITPKTAVAGNTQEDSVAKMGKLKELHDTGLITDQEFETQKGEVLARVASAPAAQKTQAGIGLAIAGLILSLLSFWVPCLTSVISIPQCLFVMFRGDKRSTKIVASIGFAIPILVLLVQAL
jgi:hypothetical protein